MGGDQAKTIVTVVHVGGEGGQSVQATDWPEGQPIIVTVPPAKQAKRIPSGSSSGRGAWWKEYGSWIRYGLAVLVAIVVYFVGIDKRLTSVEGRIGVMESDIRQLKNDVSEIKTDLAVLKDRILSQRADQLVVAVPAD